MGCITREGRSSFEHSQQNFTLTMEAHSIISLRTTILHIILQTGHTPFIRFKDESTERRLSSVLAAIHFMPDEGV